LQEQSIRLLMEGVQRLNPPVTVPMRGNGDSNVSTIIITITIISVGGECKGRPLSPMREPPPWPVLRLAAALPVSRAVRCCFWFR
jgi:hypothetical protein